MYNNNNIVVFLFMQKKLRYKIAEIDLFEIKILCKQYRMEFFLI